jgi:hypothetical protein
MRQRISAGLQGLLQQADAASLQENHRGLQERACWLPELEDVAAFIAGSYCSSTD